MKHVNAIVSLIGAAALCGSALAGFAGQTILGPLGPGSAVTGDTTGHGNDNDGWFSGDHIFDLWDGADDVWRLNWPGGDLSLVMTYDGPSSDDLDLFLYTPSDYDESSYDSFTDTGIETIDVPGAAAGVYYILVDCPAGAEGPYSLSVVPAPGAVGLATVGLLGFARRSRRGS
ncbi:MAG TPA: PPC domain-containing protein [Phycisphaerales bacterium]|nr:PPC domain-containing protein [Phycisphaerales bacterium]